MLSHYLLGSFVVLGLFLVGAWSIDLSWEVGANFVGCWWGDYEFCFNVDGLSLFFVYMLVVCGSLSACYTLHYFLSPEEGSQLLKVVLLFLVVMGVLVLSGRVVLSFICWEYLGLVSLFLILFYTNGASLRACLVTLAFSRLGDIGLFLVFGASYWDWGFEGILLSLAVFFVVLSKSAGYPTISWLIEAMRAPTPVSCLVHSSTLVTAGVWFVLRYSGYFGELSLNLLTVCSVISVLVSGVCALIFDDVKKIVAFSTCNNISWCLLFFATGDYRLCLVQLVIHGICKCFFFMVVGDLMSSAEGAQIAVGVPSTRYADDLVGFVRLFLVLCLGGFPFLGIFFSKHAFFTLVSYSWGWFYLLSLLLGLFLTSCYSIRIYVSLCGLEGGLVSGLLKSFSVVFLLVFLGTLLNWLWSGLFEECYDSGRLWSLFVVLVQVSGLFVGYWATVIHSTLAVDWFLIFLWGCVSIVASVYLAFNEVWLWLRSLIFRWESYVVGKNAFLIFDELLWQYGFCCSVVWLSFGVILVFYLNFLLV